MGICLLKDPDSKGKPLTEAKQVDAIPQSKQHLEKKCDLKNDIQGS